MPFSGIDAENPNVTPFLTELHYLSMHTSYFTGHVSSVWNFQLHLSGVRKGSFSLRPYHKVVCGLSQGLKENSLSLNVKFDHILSLVWIFFCVRKKSKQYLT